MILEHDTEGGSPLFLYVAFQAPHWPVQEKPGFAERNAHIAGSQRRKWCGLISGLDDGVAQAEALGKKWQRTA